MRRPSFKIFGIGSLFRVGPVQQPTYVKKEVYGHKIFKIQQLPMKLIFYVAIDILKLLSENGRDPPIFQKIFFNYFQFPRRTLFK